VDVGLPDLDGYAVARSVRSALGGEAIFLVAITGYGRPEDRRRAKEAGFDAHLTTPLDVEQLAGIIPRAADPDTGHQPQGCEGGRPDDPAIGAGEGR
jgi:CheY-like chemotaxis protein